MLSVVYDLSNCCRRLIDTYTEFASPCIGREKEEKIKYVLLDV